MPRESIATLGVALLAAALVVLGLLVTGGPETARAQRRDALRLEVLNDLARCLHDGPRETLASLPAELTAKSPCADEIGNKKVIAENGVRFELRSASEFALCTTFERPAELPIQYVFGRFDRDTGCLMATLGD